MRFRRAFMTVLAAALVSAGAPLVPVVPVPGAAASGADYQQAVLDDDPVGYWRLPEGSGPAGDTSTNGNTGTYVGGTGTTEGIAGATSFNGSTGYVQVPNSSTLNQPTSALTLEAWITPAPGSASSQKSIVQKSFTSHSSPHYQYALTLHDNSEGTRTLTFWLAINGQSYYLRGWESWQYDVWQHVVGTYDGVTQRLFVNGVEVAQQSVTGTVSTYSSPLEIGSYPNLPRIPNYLYGGAIDEVAVYDHALSATRVTTHYQVGTTPDPIDPKALLGVRASAGKAGDPVNTATGNFFETDVDLDFPVYGLDWTRTYNSLDTTGGPLGVGWSGGFGAQVIEQAGGDVVFTDWDGRVVTFEADGTLTVASRTGTNLTPANGRPCSTRSGQATSSAKKNSLRSCEAFSKEEVEYDAQGEYSATLP